MADLAIHEIIDEVTKIKQKVDKAVFLKIIILYSLMYILRFGMTKIWNANIPKYGFQ